MLRLIVALKGEVLTLQDHDENLSDLDDDDEAEEVNEELEDEEVLASEEEQ